MCEKELKCQSYNFVIGQKVCELNNRNKEARPDDYKPDQTRFYMKRARNRVPLGSIQELPAESCKEIKDSEGNEMVNGDYWIYSDGNGQTIRARCEENWQKINTEPVCFGSPDDNYGAFNITKTGPVKKMKLVRKSGSIKCNPNKTESYWGCTFQSYYGSNGLMTIITNAKNEAILPPAGKLINHSGCSKNHFYRLKGITHKSPELVFDGNLADKVSVSRNQKLKIWYGQDWIDCLDGNDNGTTCVDVYVWYA